MYHGVWFKKYIEGAIAYQTFYLNDASGFDVIIKDKVEATGTKLLSERIFGEIRDSAWDGLVTRYYRSIEKAENTIYKESWPKINNYAFAREDNYWQDF